MWLFEEISSKMKAENAKNKVEEFSSKFIFSKMTPVHFSQNDFSRKFPQKKKAENAKNEVEKGTIKRRGAF